MPYYLGIDTSNYTTSVALYNSDTAAVTQKKCPLPVAEGAVGLRQADAVFLHVKALGALLEELLAPAGGVVLAAVAASGTPRDEEGSYMPCFLVGETAARSVSAALGAPFHRFSHQAGHVMAALYSAGRMELRGGRFLALHVSGGTTDCLLVGPDRERVLDIRPVSRSLDLHAGQAVDRVGAMLGLPFPAGPALERMALESDREFAPKIAMKGLDCCLSGVENRCRKMLEQGEAPCDVAAYCLQFLRDTLLELTRRALGRHPGLPVVFAGGVMENSLLRRALAGEFPAFFAQPQFSADNAAGVAVLCSVRQEGG